MYVELSLNQHSLLNFIIFLFSIISFIGHEILHI
jgi:hypothetical protein